MMLKFLRALSVSAGGLFDWAVRSVFEGVTKRSLAQEAAEEAEARAREDAAADAQAQAQADRATALQARAEAEARHEETSLLAERQLEESKALREELARLARRKNEIAAQSRARDPEVRSSRWTDAEEPEPESGDPMLAFT